MMAETRPVLLGSGLRLTVISDISDIPAANFDSLDSTAGAAGCYHRVRQWQADGRWQVRYVSGVVDGRFVAGVPIINSSGRNWPDARYHPAHWGMTPESLSAEQIMLVGGCADLRSNLQICDGKRWQAIPGEVVLHIARIAAAEGRCLVFPYISGPAVKRLTAAAGGQISWRPVAREAHFDGVLEPDHESKSGSRIRGVWRRDRKLLARTDLHTWVTAWPEAAAEASGLIATHNSRKGQVDHAEFVRMRHDQWDECEQVELIVFGAECPGVRGMMSAFIWRDELELYEIGLTGSEGPHRLAAYISLLFHQPLALARERGLRRIRAGTGAETPKSSRGAAFTDLHAGLLDVQRTRMLGT